MRDCLARALFSVIKQRDADEDGLDYLVNHPIILVPCIWMICKCIHGAVRNTLGCWWSRSIEVKITCCGLEPHARFWRRGLDIEAKLVRMASSHFLE